MLWQLLIIVMLVSFNMFVADALIRMRRDLTAIHSKVVLNHQPSDIDSDPSPPAPRAPPAPPAQPPPASPPAATKEGGDVSTGSNIEKDKAKDKKA